MLVLFDQGTPVPLRQFLSGHTVRTASEQQWATLENGALLDAAEAAGFQVLVTTDKNLRWPARAAVRAALHRREQRRLVVPARQRLTRRPLERHGDRGSPRGGIDTTW